MLQTRLKPFLRTAPQFSAGRISFPTAYLAFVIGLPSIVIAATLLQTSYPVHFLYMDPISAAKAAFEQTPVPDREIFRLLFGSVSLLGNLVWFASVPLCLLAAALRKTLHEGSNITFLLFGAVLSGILAADDTFLIHEKLGNVLEYGDLMLVGLQAVATLVFLRLLKQRGVGYWWLLGVPLAFFGASVLADLIWHGAHQDARILFEDGPKLYGIFAWTAFHFVLAYDHTKASRT